MQRRRRRARSSARPPDRGSRLTVAATRVRAAAAPLGAVGVALAVVFAYAVPTSETVRLAVYSAVGCSAAVAALLTSRRKVAPMRLPWLLVAIGIAGFAVGDLIFDVSSSLYRTEVTPSIADAVYLGIGYPFFLAGAWLMTRAVGPARGAATAGLDSAIVLTAFALVQVVLALEPVIAGSGPVLDRALRATYPAMDVVVSAPIVRLLWSRESRSASLAWLGLGVAAMFVADEAYYVGGREHTWMDLCWLVAYVAWATAATVREDAPGRVVEPERDPTARRLALLSAAVAAPFVLLAIQTARGANAHGYVLAGIGTLLTGLAFARITGLTRLIERLRLVERELRVEAEEANEHLRELDRLKDEVVSVITHDLRMPLAAAHGYVELMLAGDVGPLQAEQERAIRVVGERIDHVLALARDLTLVGEAESARLALDVERLDVAEVAARAVAAARPRAETGGIELSTSATDRVEVFGDATRLGQLLDNLLANAIAYTPGRGTIDVAVHRTGHAAELLVSDSGIGIPPDDVPRLFDRFYRGMETRGPGSGLGLYIAKMIAEAHGGEIGVEGRSGGGTAVRVRLPLADV